MLKKYLFYVLPIFSFFAGNALAQNKDAIKFRADSWCPYNCDPTDKNPGYMVEVLQNAFGKENIDYANMNWARAILDTRDGTFDGIIGAAIEDAPDFVFSAPLGLSNNCFYTKKESAFKYTGMESLASVKLGVVKDYAYFEDLNAYIKKNYANREKIDEHFGDDVQEKMLQKLVAGRIGAFVEDPNVVSYVLTKNPKITGVVEVGCKQIGNLFIAFPPKNPKSKERAEKLSATTKSMIADGSMKTLLDKYGLRPWY